MLPTGTADVVIVGGGSAGCVLAARLSERPGRRVILVEAGRDTPPGQVPADVADTFYSAAYRPANMWPGTTVRWHADGPERRYDQARIMGGGSSVNAMVALRGLPADYDGWAAAGATGWGWDDVLPAFRKLECDLDFSGPLHGAEGPIPVRRHARADWPGFCRAMAAAAERRGLAFVDDLNGAPATGFGRVPMTNRADGRVSAALGYLTAAVRARPNLTILPGHEALRLLIEDGRCTGVALRGPAGDGTLRARTTVVCAGALRSPDLLMRSGLGPAGMLRAGTLPVLCDLPGVGANLHDHPAVAVGVVLARDAMQPRALRPAANMALRLTPEGGEAGDIYIGVANKTSWHALGHRLGGLIVSVFRPLSRGAVRLVPGPQGPRAVSDFAMLTDPRDMTRMVWAWRTACGLVTAPEAAAAVLEAFPAAFSDRVRALNRSGLRNRLAAAALARALDLPAPLRRRLVARMCEGGHPLSALMVDDAALQDALRRTVTGFYHPAGTCRMGAANDPFAVVDPAGRVHRVPGLRVVDASIMPQIPRGNTNVPVLMIAEKIAQGWRDD